MTLHDGHFEGENGHNDHDDHDYDDHDDYFYDFDTVARDVMAHDP